MANADKRFVGETYSRDGSGQHKWRSSHQRRMSWANLAAQEIERPPSRQSVTSATAPAVVPRRSLANLERRPSSRQSNSGGGAGPPRQSMAASASPARSTVSRHTIAFPEPGAESTGRSAGGRQGSIIGLRKSQSAAAIEARVSPKALVAGRRASSLEEEGTTPVKQKAEEPPIPRQEARRNSRFESRLEKVDEIVEMCRMAKILKIPQTAVKQSADLFKECGSTQGCRSIKDWSMTEAQFRKVLCKLTGKRKDQDLPDQFAVEAFMYADTDRVGYLDFGKFAFWLSNNSFSEDLNLDEQQRGMRALARKHGIHYNNVERYKRAFDEYDIDGSGGIDPREFENLICKCGKVPHKLGLPASRVQQWWRDADKDGNGVVDFEEFLVFQRKYFDSDGQGGQAGGREAQRSGFENYYRGIRKHCWT